jgi:hypothetical protein
MRPGERLWTQEDDEVLIREVRSGTPLSQIVKRLDRTPAAIRNRAYILRLRLGRPRAKPTPPLDGNGAP